MVRKKKILIIGGCGYIGSRLCAHLGDKYDLATVDLEWYGNENTIKNVKTDSKSLTKKYLSEYTHVIMLAGHSSVKMCENNMLSTLKNNVLNFAYILENLEKEQVLIYASSSSVYGDTKSKAVDEDYTAFKPNNYYDLSKHEIDSYAVLSDKTYFGLRFGTVNGYSPNLRNDVMINAMTFNALENKKVFCYNPEVNRPILSIDDLCRAMTVIIEKGNYENRGLYNIASFNSTVRDIATTVASCTGAQLEVHENPPENITNVKLQAKAYDFIIKTDKFEKEFDFSFEGTSESITRSLMINYENMEKRSRIDAKIYRSR
jgi:UDP-glucose 4-epimerase